MGVAKDHYPGLVGTSDPAFIVKTPCNHHLAEWFIMVTKGSCGWAAFWVCMAFPRRQFRDPLAGGEVDSHQIVWHRPQLPCTRYKLPHLGPSTPPSFSTRVRRPEQIKKGIEREGWGERRERSITRSNREYFVDPLPFGWPEHWPRTTRAAKAVVVDSRVPSLLAWDGTCLNSIPTAQ